MDAQTILAENLIGSVATVNTDGSAWITPLHIFSDENAVYWFSANDKQHSLNIEKDPRVSLALFSPDVSQGPKGVYVNGVVERLDETTTTQAKHLVEARIGFIPPVFATATGYRLPLGSLDTAKSAGNCWYFYS